MNLISKTKLPLSVYISILVYKHNNCNYQTFAHENLKYSVAWWWCDFENHIIIPFTYGSLYLLVQCGMNVIRNNASKIRLFTKKSYAEWKKMGHKFYWPVAGENTLVHHHNEEAAGAIEDSREDLLPRAGVTARHGIHAFLPLLTDRRGSKKHSQYNRNDEYRQHLSYMSF